MTRRRKIALTAAAVLIAILAAIFLGATGIVDALARTDRPTDVSRDIRSIDFQQEQGDIHTAAGTLRILTGPQSGYASINGDTVQFLPDPYQTAEVSFQVEGTDSEDATKTRVTSYLYRVTGITHTDSPIHVSRGASATYEVARTFAGYPIENTTLDVTTDDQNRSATEYHYGSNNADWTPIGVDATLHIDYAAGTVALHAGPSFTGFTYAYIAHVGDQYLPGVATFTTDSAAPAQVPLAVPKPTTPAEAKTAGGSGTPVAPAAVGASAPGGVGPDGSGSGAPSGAGGTGSSPASPAGVAPQPSRSGASAPGGASAGASGVAGGKSPMTLNRSVARKAPAGSAGPGSGNSGAATPAGGAGPNSAAAPAKALGPNGPATPREVALVQAAAAQRASKAAAVAAGGAGAGTGAAAGAGSGGGAAGSGGPGGGGGAGSGGSGTGAGGGSGNGAGGAAASPALASTGSVVSPLGLAAAVVLILLGIVVLRLSRRSDSIAAG